MAYPTVATYAPAVLEPRQPGARTRAGEFGASQTLAKGTLLAQKTADSKMYAYAQMNVVQTMAIVGTLSAGGYRLQIVDKNGVVQTTALIAYNASTADIQTAINAVIPQESATNQIVVGGTAQTATTFTFSGASYLGKPQSIIVVEPDGLTGMTSASVTDSTTLTGLEKAVGILRRDIVVDANGFIMWGPSGSVLDLLHPGDRTELFYISGDFLISELVGYDAGALADLNGTVWGTGAYAAIHIP